MSKVEKIKKSEGETPTETKIGNIQMSAESLVSDVRDLLIGILKEFPTYDSMKEDKQKILHKDVEYKVKEIVHEAIRIIAEKGADYVPAKVDSVAVKDGIKIVLKIADINDNFSIVGNMRGKEIVVVGTSLSEFDEIQRAAEVTPDQKDIEGEIEKKKGKETDEEKKTLTAEEDSWGKNVRAALKNGKVKKEKK